MILSLLFAGMADACCPKKAKAYLKQHGKPCCGKCAKRDKQEILKPTEAHRTESNHHTRSINNIKKIHHHKNKHQKHKHAKKSSVKKAGKKGKSQK